MKLLSRWSRFVDADGLRRVLLADEDSLPPSLARSIVRRRWIARLAALGLVDAAAMMLHQMGVVRRLPDPPLPRFDSNRVVSSPAAYKLGVPDATLGALQLAATAVLAGAAPTPRRGRSKLLGAALGATVLGGAIGAVAYGLDMLFVEKRACAYCLPALAISLALVPLAAPEVAAALRG